jgi:hypothetical protein
MQPNSDEWQQPEVPATAEPHPYVMRSDEPQPAANVDSKDSQDSVPRQPLEGEDEMVRWQATETIQRDKDALWFIGFGVVTIALMLVAWFIIGSITFTVLIPVMAASLVVYVRRPPIVFDYTLSRKGLHINDKLFPFEEFKEFGLIKDDDENAIMLIPRKRFQPGVIVYFPEEVGEDVVDLLAARLPMHEIKLDPIDKLIRFLRI